LSAETNAKYRMVSALAYEMYELLTDLVESAAECGPDEVELVLETSADTAEGLLARINGASE
jgi:hypothetical protein